MKGRPNKFFIITGVSGAGKSQALKAFEDFGFFCVDNLPIALLARFAALVGTKPHLHRIALGIDIREGRFLKDFAASVQGLKTKGMDSRILFLDASDKAVVQRFSETRHRHPLGTNILAAVRRERRILRELRGIADKVIDTSGMTLGELKESLSQALELKKTQEMNLSMLSFGFKYGMPLDADLVWDVRFLSNPNYEPRLQKRNGLDRPVQDHILRRPEARAFLDRFSALVQSLLPLYIREGKSYLTLAVGCTGGRHRSVFVTHWLTRELVKAGYAVREFHRDIQR